jgi:polyisoprenoid-binding protein YceI
MVSIGTRGGTTPTVVPIPAPPLPSGTWQADPAHSRIEFAARHLMITDVRGRFAAFDIRLTVGDQPADSSVFVNIQAASLDTGNEMRDKHLRSPDFFDAETHPAIVFESERVTATSESSWEVEGRLTLKGQTHPLTLHATLGGVAKDPWGKQKAGLSIRGELDRELWGLSWNQPLETGGVMIGPTVRLEIELQAVPAPAPTLFQRVSALEPLIKSHEAALERDRTLPAPIVAALKQAGVFRCFVPRSLGGLEVHPVEWLEMVEELSRINGSVGWMAMINGGTGWAGLEPSVARRLLEQTPGAISAGNATPGGRATKVDGGYIANGRWKFTSGCMHADYIGGFCTLLDPDGQPVLGKRLCA